MSTTPESTQEPRRASRIYDWAMLGLGIMLLVTRGIYFLATVCLFTVSIGQLGVLIWLRL